MYKKQNKSVRHKTNTYNARLLHVILEVISLLHHAMINLSHPEYDILCN